MIKVRVEVEVRPTENIEKVKQALQNVFNASSIRVVEKGQGYYEIIAESNSYRSLLKIHELIRRERIMDTARSILRKSLVGNMLVFKLNKQAAFQGRLSFVDSDRESPMGAITFIIETDNPQELIDWLAPRTSHGKPLWEKEMPKD